MAQRGQSIALLAAVALTARTLVKLTASKTASTAVAAADQPVGVVEFGVAAGQNATVMVSGVSKVVAGAAFAAGSKITADAQGRAVAAAPAAGTNNGIVGIAIEAAAALGDEVDVLLSPGVFQG